MLRFFTTRHDVPEIKTEHASSFQILNADEYTNKVIPFSHMYVTSDPYLRRIKKSLGEEHQEKILEINPQQKKALFKHTRFPTELTSLKINSVSDLHDAFPDKTIIDIAVVNGIGSAFGDNYAGLAILQRFAKLISPMKVRFHLMQTTDEKIKVIYENEPNIYLNNNCLSIAKFFKMDFYVNLTGMLGKPEFDQLPLSQFMATMFSVKSILPTQNIKPRLTIDSGKSSELKKTILKRFPKKVFHKDKKLILFHPKASSKIRTMESKTATKIVSGLIKNGYLVISAFPYPNKTSGFLDCSELSSDINDLLHIIDACDATISVGTAVYHMAAALQKPTVLLPTVKADVDSGALLPEVLTYLPKKSEQYISPKHKSSEEEDIETAKKIWHNVNVNSFVSALDKHIDKPDLTPAKVGVVIPHFGTQEKLNTCLDALIKVDGFDPQYLYIVDNNSHNRYFTVGVNVGIQQALDDDCDFVWVLNNDTQPDPKYIQANLARFAKNEKVGIVGGKNLVTDRPDRIFWGGSYRAFPNGVHKGGYVSQNTLRRATPESWATFSSVIIRRETLDQCGLLDGSMRMIFSDSDYSFTARLNGWEVWYEPEAVLLHDTGVSNKAPSQEIIDIFRSDKRRFYHKWSKITGEKDPEKLQQAIFDKIGWKGE